jgi:hypothetical protein
MNVPCRARLFPWKRIERVVLVRYVVCLDVAGRRTANVEHDPVRTRIVKAKTTNK